MKPRLSIGFVIATLSFLALPDTASAYLKPKIGRWLSRDPVGEPGAMVLRQAVAATPFLPRDVDEGQPYHYVQNSPTNGYDPLGDVAMGLVWLNALEDPATQPGGTTQPAPPPPNPKTNACKDEQSCCMCLLYAENRDFPKCFELVMKVACYRQNAPKSGKGGWGEWKKGNGGFCEQAESSTWQPNPIVNNKNYKDCCNRCKNSSQPSTMPEQFQKADALCSKGCAGIANPEGINFKLSEASFKKLPPNAWQRRCRQFPCGKDIFLACPHNVVHP